MSYVVLARRFRPQKFSTIAGQEHVTRALANSVLRDRIPHALLFCGPRGVGKTSAARIYAKALNCTGRNLAELRDRGLTEDELRPMAEPCDECDHCKDITRSTSMAVREIDGASNNSVDNVRELIESLRSPAPPGANYKIYIIDEVHMLSTAAFNALLKSLEEPPPRTVFIFATTEPNKIPDTVLSRCQRYDFKNLSASLIIEHLQEMAESEGINLTPEIAGLIARKAEGGMRDAQTLLDRLIAYSREDLTLKDAERLFGVQGRDFFFDLSEAVLKQDLASCFQLIDRAYMESLDLRSFAADFIEHWRDLLFVCLVGEQIERANDSVLNLAPSERKRAVEQVAQVSAFNMQRLFDQAESLVSRLLITNHPRQILEAGIAKMATLADLKPLPEILKTLQNLKQEFPQAQARSAGLAKEQIVAQRETKLESAARQNDFDPSWEAFVSFVRKRNEFILEAHLKRVSPTAFRPGILELTGKDFDISSLQHGDSAKNLKQCLLEYSGESNWKVNFKALSEIAESSPAAQSLPSAAPAEGSLQHRSIKAQQDYRKRVEAEAREKQAVREALNVFSGSVVEKVSLLKPD